MTETGTYLEGRGGNALEAGGGCLQEVLLAGMVALHKLPHTPQRLHWQIVKPLLEHNERFTDELCTTVLPMLTTAS